MWLKSGIDTSMIKSLRLGIKSYTKEWEWDFNGSYWTGKCH